MMMAMLRFAKREYQLELVTPAFLGGADQSAQWRTAGIKALIRQWWRVVWHAEHPTGTVSEMRNEEAVRFGRVQGTACKARIMIRFDEEPNSPIKKIDYLRAKNQKDDMTFAYLGYGAFEGFNQQSKKTAIDKNSKIKFKILIQAKDAIETAKFAQEIDQTMFLVHQFGALGSRSNNAWGSLFITGDIQVQDLTKYGKNLSQCLQSDWKQAISKDHQGLMVWQTSPLNSTDDVMRRLKTFRKDGHNYIAKQNGTRHLINAPVTLKNAPVRNNQNRYPSQFMLKILKEGIQYRGQVTLLAHKWHNDSHDLSGIINRIATDLDNNQNFSRITG